MAAAMTRSKKTVVLVRAQPESLSSVAQAIRHAMGWNEGETQRKKLEIEANQRAESGRWRAPRRGGRVDFWSGHVSHAYFSVVVTDWMRRSCLRLASSRRRLCPRQGTAEVAQDTRRGLMTRSSEDVRRQQFLTPSRH